MVYIGMCCWIGYGLAPLCPKQGNIILCDSVLNRVHNFVRVCPNYSLDENCSYSKNLKAMTITRICSIMFDKKMALNQESKHLSFVLNRVYILGFFCPKGDQGFKASAAMVDKERVVKNKIS